MYIVIAFSISLGYRVWYFNTLAEAQAKFKAKLSDLTYMSIAKELPQSDQVR